VNALAAWGDTLISGSCDHTIRVWDLSTWGLDATLTGHEDSVCALAVEGEWLYSASVDGSHGTIRVWDVGAWAEAMSVAASGTIGAWQHPLCLLTSGSKLISGCVAFKGDDDDDTDLKVRV
jgi:WD40 repeat protein